MIVMTRELTAVIFITAVLFLSYSFKSYADEIEQAPVDPDISDICTLSDCNPARPCAEEGKTATR